MERVSTRAFRSRGPGALSGRYPQDRRGVSGIAAGRGDPHRHARRAGAWPHRRTARRYRRAGLVGTSGSRRGRGPNSRPPATTRARRNGADLPALCSPFQDFSASDGDRLQSALEGSGRTRAGVGDGARPSHRRGIGRILRGAGVGNVRRAVRYPVTGHARVRELVSGRRSVSERVLLPPRERQDFLFQPRSRDVRNLSPARNSTRTQQRGPLGRAGGFRRAYICNRAPLEELPSG